MFVRGHAIHGLTSLEGLSLATTLTTSTGQNYVTQFHFFALPLVTPSCVKAAVPECVRRERPLQRQGFRQVR